jgi:hypothetical protein
MNRHVPDYMNSAFAAQGVDAGKLIYAIHTDLDLNGGHSDAYVALDADHLYVLYGRSRW